MSPEPPGWRGVTADEKARDVRKTSDRRDAERIGQRWMKPTGEMCTSILPHLKRPSASVSLRLSSSRIPRRPRVPLSFMPMEFKGARVRDGTRQLVIAVTLHSSRMFSVSITYSLASSRPPPPNPPLPHTHTTQQRGYKHKQQLYFCKDRHICKRLVSQGDLMRGIDVRPSSANLGRWGGGGGSEQGEKREARVK